MSRKLNPNTLQKALDWSYEAAINGFGGLCTVEELAENYLNKPGRLSEQMNSLIAWHTTTAATTGFVTGLGGIITLPVAISADLTIVLVTQLRMIAAIAYMGGYDVRDHQVRSFCYVCLCGNSAGEILKGIGIKIGRNLTEQGIKRLSFEVIKKINQAVGFRLLTKFGSTGAINLGKAIPIIGGVVGGAFDGMTTKKVGSVAKKVFVTRHTDT